MERADEVTHVRACRAGVPAHRRRELVDCPRVAGGDVVACGGHSPASLDSGVSPRPCRIRSDPGRPARDVDLGHRVEARSEGVDAGRAERLAEPRLVGRQGGNGDVVIRTRRRIGRKLLAQAHPVFVRVEDGFEVDSAVRRKPRIDNRRGGSAGIRRSRGLGGGLVVERRHRVGRLKAVDGGKGCDVGCFARRRLTDVGGIVNARFSGRRLVRACRSGEDAEREKCRNQQSKQLVHHSEGRTLHPRVGPVRNDEVPGTRCLRSLRNEHLQ